MYILTVVLILIPLPDPAGIARTMQAKSDLSSKRDGSFALTEFIKFVACEIKTELSDEVIMSSLHSAETLEVAELLGAVDPVTLEIDCC